MVIRFLTADDAEDWWRLRLEALRDDPKAFSSSVEEHQKLAIDEVRRRLNGNADSFVVGAFEERRLVGIAGFHHESGLKSRHKGRIWGVYLTPSYRAQGVGRKMLEALLQRAATVNGLEQVQLSVTATQTAALALYRSLGFESFGCEPGALKVGDEFIDEEYMVLRVRG